jgi:hypothetical protein
VVSSLSSGVLRPDFAELLGLLISAFGLGTMMRGDAERARGEARMCFGSGGSGRVIGGSGLIRGMLAFAERWHVVPGL